VVMMVEVMLTLMTWQGGGGGTAGKSNLIVA